MINDNYMYNKQWLEETFIPYLDKWEESVNNRTGFTDAKKAMLLSTETRNGLRMTSKYIVLYMLIIM